MPLKSDAEKSSKPIDACNLFKKFYFRFSMLKVGLTGGIGSGKTTVAKLFELLNVPVYYADAASKRLYHTDAEIMANLKKEFGEAIYTNNQLNRTVLAGLVFGDAEKLARLNALVHPPTIRDAEAWMQQQKAPYILKEAALLFESGSVRSLDFVIGVHAPMQLRLRRVMARDGLTESDVRARMDRQLAESLKMKLCDFVITNDDTEAVLPQVLNLHQHLLQKVAQPA